MPTWLHEVDNWVFYILFVAVDIAIGFRILIFLYRWIRNVLRNDEGNQDA